MLYSFLLNSNTNLPTIRVYKSKSKKTREYLQFFLDFDLIDYKRSFVFCISAQLKTMFWRKALVVMRFLVIFAREI